MLTKVVWLLTAWHWQTELSEISRLESAPGSGSTNSAHIAQKPSSVEVWTALTVLHPPLSCGSVASGDVGNTTASVVTAAKKRVTAGRRVSDFLLTVTMGTMAQWSWETGTSKYLYRSPFDCCLLSFPRVLSNKNLPALIMVCWTRPCAHVGHVADTSNLYAV